MQLFFRPSPFIEVALLMWAPWIDSIETARHRGNISTASPKWLNFYALFSWRHLHHDAKILCHLWSRDCVRSSTYNWDWPICRSSISNNNPQPTKKGTFFLKFFFYFLLIINGTCNDMNENDNKTTWCAWDVLRHTVNIIGWINNLFRICQGSLLSYGLMVPCPPVGSCLDNQ